MAMEMQSLENENENVLHAYFAPYVAASSHFLPLFQVAKLFSSRGVHVTFLATPHMASLIRHSFGGDDHPFLTFDFIDFPSEEVGLPDDIQTYSSSTTFETAAKLFSAFLKLNQPMEERIRAARPDFVVADSQCYWASDLGIPRLVYQGTGFFPLCSAAAIYLHSPHLTVKSDSDKFLLPGLPDPIQMTRSELAHHIQSPGPYTQFSEKVAESIRRSFGVIVSSFQDFEGDYANHYRAVSGLKSWPIGPIQLHYDSVFNPVAKKTERHPCLQWLDQIGEENKVVYVNFGSMAVFGTDQLSEIASGLESSGHRFIWVVRKTVNGEDDEWIPDGFEERLRASNMGVLLKGWAPQVEILNHHSVGGFVTHCGWNSIAEAVAAGVSVVTWPLSAEHFYIRRLVMDVLKIGVDIGNTKWGGMIEATDELIQKERIEKAVKELMDGDEAVVRRERSAELGNCTRKAVEDGGSSRTNLTAVIEELQRVKMGAN